MLTEPFSVPRHLDKWQEMRPVGELYSPDICDGCIFMSPQVSEKGMFISAFSEIIFPWKPSYSLTLTSKYVQFKYVL